MSETFTLSPVGHVRRRDDTYTILEIEPQYVDALCGLSPGDRLDVLYWMHALRPVDRELRKLHPRGDKTKPIRGVFGLRSPMRPNPIGVSPVTIERIDGRRLLVRGLDAFDGTPILDMKAAREPSALREVIHAWGRIHDAMVRALFELGSEDACRNALEDPMRKVGAEAAGPVGKPLTPAQIGRRIMDFEAYWDIEGSVQENNSACFRREVVYCPWAHFHPLSCRVLGWYMEGFAKACNPACAYRLLRIMPQGDATCAWAVERVKDEEVHVLQ
jgi:tRNA-Thr(GGU) m(6)t(6)A37 methyltransferase TsaA